MDFTNIRVYSLTDCYGFELGKQYIVVSDNDKEVVMENGQRFFKSDFERLFSRLYTKLFKEVKERIERATKENHKLFLERTNLNNRIKTINEAVDVNKEYINRLEKLI